MTLDVRLGPFENDEREVVPEETAIFLMLDSPLLDDPGNPALHTFRWDCRRVRGSIHGDARRRGNHALPDLSSFSPMHRWGCAERERAPKDGNGNERPDWNAQSHPL